MRENRPYGSEGGGAEFNRSFLPLSLEEILKLDSMDQVSNSKKSDTVASRYRFKKSCVAEWFFSLFFGSYPEADTAPGCFRSPRCDLKIDSRFLMTP
jgi:hypothetical protein